MSLLGPRMPTELEQFTVCNLQLRGRRPHLLVQLLHLLLQLLDLGLGLLQFG